LDHRINLTNVDGLTDFVRWVQSGDEQRRLRDHPFAPNAHAYRLFKSTVSNRMREHCAIALVQPVGERARRKVNADWVALGATRCSAALTKECSYDEASPHEQSNDGSKIKLEIFTPLATATLSSSKPDLVG
jgi:hypothetical protein